MIFSWSQYAPVAHRFLGAATIKLTFYRMGETALDAGDEDPKPFHARLLGTLRDGNPGTPAFVPYFNKKDGPKAAPDPYHPSRLRWLARRCRLRFRIDRRRRFMSGIPRHSNAP